MIVPEAHLVLGGHLSVSSLRSPVVQRFPGPTRPKAAPSGSMPSSANSPPGISIGPLITLPPPASIAPTARSMRSAEHTSELQSLMRISYTVFCLKNTKSHNKAIRDMSKKPAENDRKMSHESYH